MGYCIEPSGSEHIILNFLKLVKKGCVDYNHRKQEITLYYEAEKELTPTKAIGHISPKYTTPVSHCLLKLKRSTNGKIVRLYYNELIEK